MEWMPIENEIVDADTDDEAIEVQRPHGVAVGRGPTKLDIEHNVASGQAQHRTLCDACVSARGIDGRRENWESGREDEDPLIAMDRGCWELHGTEDDNDDDHVEVAQNKSLIFVAKDANT